MSRREIHGFALATLVAGLLACTLVGQPEQKSHPKKNLQVLPPPTTVQTPLAFPRAQGGGQTPVPPFVPGEHVGPATPLLVLEGPILELVEFRDLDLDEALRIFSQQSGLRVIASPIAGKQKVTLYLENVNAAVALDALIRANGLLCRRDPGAPIVTLYTLREYQQDLASFREEVTRTFTLLYPNAYDVAIAIRDLYGSRVRLSFGTESDTTVMQDLQQRFSRFDMIDQRSQSAGTFGGAGVGGIGFGGVGGGVGGLGGGIGAGGVGGLGGIGGGLGLGGAGMGSGIGLGGGGNGAGVNQGTAAGNNTGSGTTGTTGANTTAGQQDQNVSVYLTVIRRHNQIVVRTSDPRAMGNICDLIAKLDIPTPLVLLEVKVLSIDLSDNFSSIFDFQFADASLSAGQFTNGDILPPLADVGAPPPTRPQAIPPQGTGLRPDHLIFQMVSSNFRVRMQLLEQQNRVTEVATPMVLTANNEVSRIFVGQTQPITVGFTPGQFLNTGVGTNASLSPTPITQLTDIGTQLLITPNINADRTVSLRITQQQSNVVLNGGTIPVPNQTGGVTNVPVDIVRRRTFSGTVVAKDALTVAIGGLIEEDVRDTRGEVPVIGKLPYLGFFFRRQDTRRNRREQVIMIRPYVFYTPVESAALSHDLMKQLSINPLSPNAEGTLNSFLPREVLRPNPPENQLQTIFKVHTVTPKDF